jgi:hypothetical protein
MYVCMNTTTVKIKCTSIYEIHSYTWFPEATVMSNFG